MSGREPSEAAIVEGERSVPIERQMRGATRLQAGVALLLVAGLVFAFLIWWYGRAADAALVPEVDAARWREQAATEMVLPALGSIPPPTLERGAAREPEPVEAEATIAANGAPDGEPPSWLTLPGTTEATWAPVVEPVATPAPHAEAAPAVDARLVSPVLWRAGGSDAAYIRSGAEPDAGGGSVEEGASATGTPAAVRVRSLGPRDRLLGRGSLIDATLETAIDSQLPGLATAVLSAPAWSADGARILLAAGTRLIGSVSTDVRAGQSRVRILWEEARTPEGWQVTLASPATDALGRAGLAGRVDTHFEERFGAAILLSIVDAGAQALAASARGDGQTLVVNTQGASELATEVLRQTIAIPPTIRVPQGARVRVIVARDADFAAVLTTREPA
jgi:type IV secretion system protein VirB10